MDLIIYEIWFGITSLLYTISRDRLITKCFFDKFTGSNSCGSSTGSKYVDSYLLVRVIV